MFEKNITKSVKYIVAFGVFLNLFFQCQICPAAAAIYHDPAIFHETWGVIPFYRMSEEDRWVSFDISPFYQNAHKAKNACGKCVPIGDRLGRWNMLGLLHGTDAAPTTSTFVVGNGNYPNLYEAKTQLDAISPVYTQDTFTDSTRTFAYYTMPLKFEKFGARGRLFFNIGKGFFARVRGGFQEYSQCFTSTCATCVDCATCSNPNARLSTFTDLTACSTMDTVTITTAQTYLMSAAKRDAIAKEICLDISKQSKVGLEDTHVELGWSGKFGMKDEKDNLIVTFCPYLAVGAWLPTGIKKNQDQAFSLATGNDGFFGVSFETGFNFDFPESVQVNLGGGATFFETKNLSNMRVPSSDTQSGIYPWKTCISKRLGNVWHIYAGFMAEHFLEKLSFYFNYVYTRKNKDAITIKDSDATRCSKFKPEKLEEESFFESQVYHVGLDYDVTKELAFGISVQAPITGKNVLKTTTILGTLRFNF